MAARLDFPRNGPWEPLARWRCLPWVAVGRDSAGPHPLRVLTRSWFIITTDSRSGRRSSRQFSRQFSRQSRLISTPRDWRATWLIRSGAGSEPVREPPLPNTPKSPPNKGAHRFLLRAEGEYRVSLKFALHFRLTHYPKECCFEIPLPAPLQCPYHDSQTCSIGSCRIAVFF